MIFRQVCVRDKLDKYKFCLINSSFFFLLFVNIGIYTCKLHIVTELVTNAISYFRFVLLLVHIGRLCERDKFWMLAQFSLPNKVLLISTCGRFYLINISGFTDCIRKCLCVCVVVRFFLSLYEKLVVCLQSSV